MDFEISDDDTKVLVAAAGAFAVILDHVVSEEGMNWEDIESFLHIIQHYGGRQKLLNIVGELSSVGAIRRRAKRGEKRQGWQQPENSGDKEGAEGQGREDPGA